MLKNIGIGITVLATPFMIYPMLYVLGGTICSGEVSFHIAAYEGITLGQCWHR